eukprot:scaffold32273_cov31-Phaeocystis_antarctica.AAC.1
MHTGYIISAPNGQGENEKSETRFRRSSLNAFAYWAGCISISDGNVHFLLPGFPVTPPHATTTTPSSGAVAPLPMVGVPYDSGAWDAVLAPRGAVPRVDEYGPGYVHEVVNVHPPRRMSRCAGAGAMPGSQHVGSSLGGREN